MQSFNNLTPSSSLISANATVETVLNREDDCSCGKCIIHHHTARYFAFLSCMLLRPRILNKIDGDDLNCKCITDSSAFRIMCLNEDILRVSFRRTLTIRKKRRKSSREMFDDRARRWTAYSQFIFWIYDGILGKSIRKMLPNCVYMYNAIRQTFPSHNCEYTDFSPGDNDEIFID